MNTSIVPARRSGMLFVISSPSGAGKTTLARMVADSQKLVFSVSYTTRAPRPGERDSVDYKFVTDDEFSRMVDGQEFAEWAVVHGQNRYGTPRVPVEEHLAAGAPALLEIDLQGARQVRQSMPAALFVFLAPPSWQELERRLVGRGTEDAEERERRLSTARVELAAEPEFDVVIVNDDVHRATDELVGLMGLVTR